jgi:uncharacterized protein YndB with AHSA1/START domain
MPEFRFGAMIPFPRDEVFDYVSDPRHWPEFFREVEAVDQVEGWDRPGGRCRVRVRVLGRRQYIAELVEFDRPRLTRDVARQAGMPDVEHEHVFSEVPEGTRLDNIARYRPRPGLVGLYDRTVLRWAAQRTYRRMYARATASVTARLTDRQHPQPNSAA